MREEIDTRDAAAAEIAGRQHGVIAVEQLHGVGFDKSAISAIEKAIQTSDLGITPNNDGNVIRLAFPPLTEERRRELVKQVHARAEDGRVAVRNVRRHAKDELEKLEHGGDISEDDLQRAEKDLQKLTDRFVTDIDQIQGHKEQELMEV